MEVLPQETEIKLRVSSAVQARRLLARHGFTVTTKRHFEQNVLYDTDPPTLRPQGQLLRLREAAGKTILTFKGSATAQGRHKSREEIETPAGDGAALREILKRLRLRPGFIYEKYRTEFRRPRDQGCAVLDETPIGVFLELEGPPDWIDRMAQKLGFRPEEYILLSYGALWAQQGTGGDFVFPDRDPKGRRRSK